MASAITDDNKDPVDFSVIVCPIGGHNGGNRMDIMSCLQK